jgi:hypothetical protein
MLGKNWILGRMFEKNRKGQRAAFPPNQTNDFNIDTTSGGQQVLWARLLFGMIVDSLKPLPNFYRDIWDHFWVIAALLFATFPIRPPFLKTQSLLAKSGTLGPSWRVSWSSGR